MKIWKRKIGTTIYPKELCKKTKTKNASVPSYSRYCLRRAVPAPPAKQGPSPPLLREVVVQQINNK